MPHDPAPDLGTPGEATTTLITSDGEAIAVWHQPALAGPESARGVSPAPGPCFVLAHGFTVASNRTRAKAVVALLRRHGAVVTFDFRGHGASSGYTTVGAEEVHDLDAVIRWARGLGYGRVITIGFSMGAAVAIRQAALTGGVDAVVAISGPSRWRYRGSRAMRLLHRGCETAAGRWVLARWYDTRVSKAGWYPPPAPPDALIGRIGVPVLIVHGDADHYFPVDHPRWLAHAGGPDCDLWIEPGMGHAEDAVAPALGERIATWSLDAVQVPMPVLGHVT